MQISTIITFALVILAVVCYSSANPTSEEELNIIDPATLDAPDRVRRGCDCRTTTGRCVDTGKYQCYFRSSGASIVQCVGGNRWVTIGNCPSSCRSWGNDQPYCS
ncbi:unnamed protein product [Adineta ricciae]|uniref:Uncharacterized protein n=1 Tax=Adineta ricciae TaxID=249248 RepID=A0A814UDW6_ADIRI|nr:unnamed protein product [Adineta ricciae]CAF1175430.1 unnamed protein product [Adineta ricciae]